jgi:glycosyltransferase involved in cell wall biosynthesis
VCALRPEKGLGTLLDAFSRISRVFEDARLLIAGNGPSLAGLEAQAGALGITGRCTFLPASDDVAGLLRRIDIFVLPSLSEALSNSLMEAMARGCCAVASTVGGNPELVAHGDTGFLFPPRDAASLSECLRLLIENAELRSRLADKGSRFIRANFSQEASARRMAEIYRSLVRGGGRN